MPILIPAKYINQTKRIVLYSISAFIQLGSTYLFYFRYFIPNTTFKKCLFDEIYSQKQQMLHNYSKKTSSESTAQVGDIVWAKITGYPWWPATITEIIRSDKNICRVDFVNDQNYTKYSIYSAYLSMDKIIGYGEGREMFQNVKKSNKQLAFAVKIAEEGSNKSKKVRNQNILSKFARDFQQQKKLSEREGKERQDKESILSLETQHINSRVPYSHKKQRFTKRQRFIIQILNKYGLSEVPRLSKQSNIQKITQIKHCRTDLHRANLKIYRLLKTKNIERDRARNIAMALGVQVLKQNSNKCIYLSNLLRWLKITDDEIVEKYYDRWWECKKVEDLQQKPTDILNYQ